jgi:hypothetical protein
MRPPSKDIKGAYLSVTGLWKGVMSHKVTYSYPMCHNVEIHPKVVEFIKNYEFKE